MRSQDKIPQTLLGWSLENRKYLVSYLLLTKTANKLTQQEVQTAAVLNRLDSMLRRLRPENKFYDIVLLRLLKNIYLIRKKVFSMLFAYSIEITLD